MRKCKEATKVYKKKWDEKNREHNKFYKRDYREGTKDIATRVTCFIPWCRRSVHIMTLCKKHYDRKSYLERSGKV